MGAFHTSKKERKIGIPVVRRTIEAFGGYGPGQAECYDGCRQPRAVGADQAALCDSSVDRLCVRRLCQRMSLLRFLRICSFRMT